MSDRILVKICGVTTTDDALAIAEAGADWIGLNFHPPSPRFVEEDVARAIVLALPASCRAVGLFVNRSTDEVRAVADRVGLEILQLHGDEPPEELETLRDRQLIRAFRLRDEAAIASMLAYLGRCRRPPDAVLVDAFAPGLAGGTGVVVADALLDRLPPLPRLILAGGLTPENVAEKAARVRPWMVDVAGGVESSPGRKDLGRVRAFVASARDSRLGHAPC